ncbi:MAG: hypothetical protein J1F35_06360 [Erysipelotrichales bacterium]|nr:hypothetical protein [Erysipelotrichales bacterium]
MFKPLLRTTPLYSGNVKIACELRDYKKIDKDTFECNIRSAKLYPISHQLYQKNIECGLLGSSYEYDLRKFYSAYSNYFYENCFEYPKEEMQIIDFAQSQYQRNTDFEYGAKRISYQKSGYQYAFFAPIYIESEKDIPNAFIIDLELYFGKDRMKISKQIKINIGSTKNSNENYIYPYLYKYASKIDGLVCHISQDSDNALYYGIDCVNGGFTKKVDNLVTRIFKEQTTINNFDATISLGFKHSQMVMKQIIPLCFMFNIDEILSKSELSKYINCNVCCSGYYLDSLYNRKNAFYDFSFDYDNFTQNIMKMDELSGILKEIETNINICNQSFPCLNEAYLSEYQFSNKISPMFTRWKLKYSSDDYPYITNLNYAFSKNQNSIYKYREFPTNFLELDAICNVIKNSNYENVFNFLFPLGSVGKSWYKKYLPMNGDESEKTKEDYIYSIFVEHLDHLNSTSILTRAEEISKMPSNNTELKEAKYEKIKELYIELGYDEKEILSEGDIVLLLYDLTYFVEKIFGLVHKEDGDDETKEELSETLNILTFNEVYDLLIEYYDIIEGRNQNTNFDEWYEKIKENNIILNIDLSKTEERSFWETLWSHWNGQYVSEDVEIKEMYPKNLLFTFLLKKSTEEGAGRYNSILSAENNSIIDRYNFVRNNYSCDWFSILENLEYEWWKTAEWLDVVDDKVYYKGILYDLNHVYNLLNSEEYEKVDKFGVFLYPNFKPLKDDDYENIIYSEWALARSQDTIMSSNCNYNYDMISEGITYNNSTYIFDNENNNRARTADWQYNKQFKKYEIEGIKKEKYVISESTYFDEYIESSKIIDSYGPIFISLEDTNLQYSEINKYYDYSDIENVLYVSHSDQYSESEDINEIVKDIIGNTLTGINRDNVITSYELLPIHTSYMVTDKNIYKKIISKDAKYASYGNCIDFNTPFTSILNPDDESKQDGIIFDTDIANDRESESNFENFPNNYDIFSYTYLNNTLFISDINDMTIKPSQNSLNQQNTAYTYFWAGPLNLAKKEYGVNFYRKGNFVKSTNLDAKKLNKILDLIGENGELDELKDYTYFYLISHPEKYNEQTYPNIFYNYDMPIDNKVESIARSVKDLCEEIYKELPTRLNNFDEYEFHPICVSNNGDKFAFSIFTKRTPETSRFYGSQIDESEMSHDIDCLWVDEYNLYNAAYYMDNPEDTTNLINKLINNDKETIYKHEFFAKFLSKKHIYHWVNQLSKNYKLERKWKFEEWDKNIFVRMRRMINDESIPESDFKYYQGNYEDFKKIFKISIKDEYIPLSRYVEIYYPKYKYEESFLDFYANNLVFNSVDNYYQLKLYKDDGGFYYTNPIELVFKKDFIRLNESLFNLINLELKDKYKDLYIYYIQTIKEYEDEYKNYLDIKYIDLQGLNNTGSYEGFVKKYLGEFRDIDQCLVPLFNDIFRQPRNETELYSAKTLQKITKTIVYQKDKDNSKSKIDTIYRYDKSTTSVVVELVQHDIDVLTKIPENYNHLIIEEDGKKRIMTPFEKRTGKKLEDCLYKPYTVCDFNLYQDPRYDQLKYISMNSSNSNLINENISLSTIVDKDGTKYGFYLIKLDFDNTTNSFNLRGMREILNKQTGITHYKFDQKINFFKYINSYNIVDRDDPEFFDNYTSKVIRELLPFMKIQPLNILNKMSCVVNPKMYSLISLYNTIPLVEGNKEIKERKILFQEYNNRQSLLRYMNSVVPYIPQTNSVVKNQYNLKFKNIQGDVIETGKLNSIGDSVIYKENIYLSKYQPIKIFTINNSYNQGSDNKESNNYNPFYHIKSYNTNIFDFSPFEYKHYNCSKVLNTPSKLEYRYPNNVYYDALENLESEENTYKVFKHLISNILNTLDDDVKENFAKYLYSKYSVQYDTVSTGLDISKTRKIYKLIYKFNLL